MLNEKANSVKILLKHDTYSFQSNIVLKYVSREVLSKSLFTRRDLAT